MDHKLLQERIGRAEKAMEEAQTEFNEAKKVFSEDWKKTNTTGSNTALFHYLKKELTEFFADVKSKEEIYKTLVATYEKLVEKMPQSVNDAMEVDDIKRMSVKDYVLRMENLSIKSSSETNLSNSQNEYVELPIPSINGNPNILYSTEFYKYLTQKGITPAAKKFVDKMGCDATMLIGTSGSGKTATCFEVGRMNYSLYFDCFSDADFNWFIETAKEYAKTNSDIEEYCRGMYYKLLHARYYLLNRLFVEKTLEDDRTPWKWFSYQRSTSFQLAVKSILYDPVTKTPASFFDDCNIKLEVIMFDEANYLLDLLQNRISSTSEYPNSRTLLSLIVRINQKLRLPHIYAGTHLSMKDESVILSGAGGGKENCRVFSDFDFYTPC
jgi:hypothetical protein